MWNVKGKRWVGRRLLVVAPPSATHCFLLNEQAVQHTRACGRYLVQALFCSASQRTQVYRAWRTHTENSFGGTAFALVVPTRAGIFDGKRTEAFDGGVEDGAVPEPCPAQGFYHQRIPRIRSRVAQHFASLATNAGLITPYSCPRTIDTSGLALADSQHTRQAAYHDGGHLIRAG